MKLFLGILAAAILSACAPALYQADALGNISPNSAEKVQIQFAATANSDSAEFPAELQSAYRSSLSEAIPAGCTLNLSFTGTVDESYASPWYFGLLLLAPLWPAMPRESDISVTLNSELVCDGVAVETAMLFEEEHPRLFWYGPYRGGYVQERTNLIHTKLVARLKQSLLQNTPVDESIRSDIF